jgi:hypothetical protein
MVNLEGLSKYIDSTQLTSDLDGSLHYDHAQWIDIRLVSIYQFNNCLVIFYINFYLIFFLEYRRIYVASS